MYLYLLINIFVILFPLLFSFEKKYVHFIGNITPVTISLTVCGLFMIIWDHFFTVLGVWKFNEKHLIGINIWELPLEEMLFFITIPYACLFIYEVVKKYSINVKVLITRFVVILLLLICTVILYMYYYKLYTATTVSLVIYLLINHLIVIRTTSRYLGKFHIAFLFIMIPFFIVNGILTSMPVVIYNPDDIIGFRMGTIPFEDMFYNYFMLLLVVTVYEAVLKWRDKRVKLKKNVSPFESKD